MEINWALKSALVRRFGSQIEAAHELGIRESRLSYIVRGHVKPSEQERKVLERVLGRKVVRRALKAQTRPINWAIGK